MQIPKLRGINGVYFSKKYNIYLAVLSTLYSLHPMHTYLCDTICIIIYNTYIDFNQFKHKQNIISQVLKFISIN